MVAVNLNHGYAMESEVGQLVNTDVAPFIFGQSGHIAKGYMVVRVVLGQIPCAWSKGVKQLHHENWRVFQLLGAWRVIAHGLGDGGNKLRFFHRVRVKK